MKPPLLIRADAGPAIGLGHVMRCLALAQVWQYRGGEAHLAAVELPGRVERRLRAEGVAVHRIQEGEGAAHVAALTKKLGASWVVVDGYRFNADYQRSAAGRAARVLVIDDYGATGSWDANLLLDQNLGASRDMYEGIPGTFPCLLGPRYCLLRREFRERKRSHINSQKAVLRVLILAGGGSGDAIWRAAIAALTDIAGRQLHVRVLVGPGETTGALGQAASRVNIELDVVRDADNVAALMEWADVAISAAGSTAWELSFMGVPSLLIPVAANQERIADRLHREGAAIAVRDPSRIGESLRILVEDDERRRLMQSRSRKIVDGMGAMRVVGRMMAFSG